LSVVNHKLSKVATGLGTVTS